MSLEDHLGDILRKARKRAQVALEAAARAGGITAGQLTALEESGVLAQRPDFTTLAPLLKLDAKKVEAIATGWEPSAKVLSRWRELRVITTTSDGMAVNAYLVWDEVTREAALFDTGWEAAPIVELIAGEHLNLRYLFLTHTHEDHIAALEELLKAFPKALLRQSTKSAPPQHRNRPNDCLQLGSLRITHRETPGHAEDGVIYLVGNWPDDAPHVGIIGDTIFAGTMANGFISWPMLEAKVREHILTLPAETLLCPGHGPLTTVAEEKAHNPFF
jgi:glyoxylase-like metal-dependent hydrolase (beta-lactamase superfamily II)